MAMIKPGMSVDLLDEWRGALARWKFQKWEHFNGAECDRLVQSIVDDANVRERESGKMIDEMATIIAGTRGEFRSKIVHGMVLNCMLNKVYVTRDHRGGLHALFDSINIDDKTSDENAYFALDTVRIVLRHVIVREEELCEVKREILELCYDTIQRAAWRNGLVRLAELMGDKKVRDEFCGVNAQIVNMAMLRVSVYDKRDIPPDDGIREILAEYPALKKILGADDVVGSKSHITQLIHHISANYLVKRENYEKIHAVVYESNIRIRYWINQIYVQHNSSLQPIRDSPERAMLQPSLRFLNVLSSIRYLVLEICEFLELCERDHRVVGRAELKDPGGIYRIIQEQGRVRDDIKKMRDGFGARPAWTFKEISEQVESMGLDTFVLYAHLVLMFQDAVYGTIPSRYHRDERPVKPWQVPVSWMPVTVEEVREMEKAYEGMSVSPKKEHQSECATMHESLLCLMMLDINFTNVSEHIGEETLDAHMKFSNEVYNLKYMILELANFVEQYEKLAPEVKTRTGKEIVPDFLVRKEKYFALRDLYSAHTQFDDSPGIQQIITENPDLVSKMLRDVQEARIIVTKMSPEFQEYEACAVSLMTDMEMDGVERELDYIRGEFNECNGNGFGEISRDQALQKKRERMKKILGVE